MAKYYLLMCFISAFVLISDQLKIVNASPVDDAHVREVRAVAAEDKYSTRYDNIDVDSILASKRLLLNYVNCMLDKGPCTADGRELKKYVPDALATECSKCSKKQKEIAGKVFADLLLNHRDYWNLLTAKYDPDGVFQKKYEVSESAEDYSDLDDSK